MKPIKLSIVLFTSKVYIDGSSPIYIRLSHLGKTEYIPTGHNVKPENFDSREKLGKCFTSKKFNEVYSKYERDQMRPDDAKAKKDALAGVVVHPSAHRINDDISSLRERIEKAIALASHNDRTITIHQIKQDILRDYKPNSFLAYAKDRHRAILLENRIGTARRYGAVISKIEYYLKGKDITFPEITENWLTDYTKHLQSDRPKFLKNGIPSGHEPNSTNTIFTNIKTIREILFYAARKKVYRMDVNPFDGEFKMNWEAPMRTKLTKEEVLKISQARFKDGSRMELARMIFMFCFYHAGIRIRDAINLKWQDIHDPYIRYKQQKTDKIIEIRLRPETKYILDYFQGVTFGKSEFIFPLVKQDVKDKLEEYADRTSKTSLINNELRDIAKKLGIKKKLSTHIARHSFAQIAIGSKMSIAELSTALVHSSTKVTLGYVAGMPNDELADKLDQVFSFDKPTK